MPEKLLEYNRLEIKRQLDNEDNCKSMVKTVQELVKCQFTDR